MRENIDKVSFPSVNHELIDFAYTILDDYTDDPSEIYSTRPFDSLSGLFEVNPEAYASTWDCPHLYVSVQLGRSTLKGESAYFGIGRDTDPGNKVHVFVADDEVKVKRGSIGDLVQLSDEQANSLLSELQVMTNSLSKVK